MENKDFVEKDMLGTKYKKNVCKGIQDSNSCSLGSIKQKKSVSNLHLINKRKHLFSKSNLYKQNNRGQHKIKVKKLMRNNTFSDIKTDSKSNLCLSKRKKCNSISYAKLVVLSKKHPNKILLSLLDNCSGFLSLLKQKRIKQKLIPRVCIALGKASTSDLLSNISNLIKAVSQNGKFLFHHMQQYFVFLQRQKNFKKVHLDSVFYFTVFLEKFQSILSSESSKFITSLLPLLDSVSRKCLFAEDSSHCTISKKVKEIGEKNKFPQKQFTSPMTKKEFESETQLQEPLQNFRMLPVLPTVDDIHLPMHSLRPNVVKGKYEDVDDYLDVQYRLLREDYIQPFRDGITEYISMKKLGKCIKKGISSRIYYNVCIISKTFEKGNLIYHVQFSDKSFSKIKWSNSKRFLTGSLLCFSLDDFQTMLFASIFHRDPKLLEKGLVSIQFEESTKVLNLSKLSSFVVIETSAYFEAYRHNLSALKELDAQTLPLKEYFVYVQKNVKCPKYLSTAVTFDMRPLLLPLDKQYIKQTSNDNVKYEYPETISSSVQFVRVMDDQSWPKATELNLDNSQYRSLITGITKELAIIQGPPGTGKTYIGLRIVQLLLHNLNKWCPLHRTDIDKYEHLPILVVCYTNHALDQFLEGLILFTKKICRVGGRSSNTNVSKFNLRNLRKSKYIPRNYMFCKIEHEINSIITKINSAERKCIELPSETVLTLLDLQKCISRAHYISLTKNNQLNNGCIISDWLYVNESVVRSENYRNKFSFKDYFDASLQMNDEFECEDDADIEDIENQCNINLADDYSIFSVTADLGSIYEGRTIDKFECETTEQKQHLKLINYIKNCLDYYEPMEEEIVMKIDCVWSLELDKRWQLYKYWLQKFIEEMQKEYFNLQEKLKAKLSELAEIRIEEDLKVIRQCHVVGMTTTGAAKYRQLVQGLKPIILIAEEAAEVLESHIITSLVPTTEHVILIGDHQQLRPSPTVHVLATKYNMNISLFERMIHNDVEYCRLSVQHRMRPDFASLIVPHIYLNLENHRDVTNFENIKGVAKNLFFISHNFRESSHGESTSKVNVHEAKFMIQLCNYFLLQGYHHSQITVLTTYSAQLFVMKRLATDAVKKVHFTVVDNFQGEENDIILISFVRSNSDGIIGFLKVPNRVCVALSRAKKGLYCIGNFELLAEKSNLWKNIVETLNQKQSIGSSLQLICQNHPDMHNEVAKEADFKNVPNGGCNLNCEYQLLCGHTCTRKCHMYDQDHEMFLCEIPCSRTCERGHPCDKGHPCFESCYCKVLVKRLQRCGHVVEDYCGKPEKEIFCKKPCEKTCKDGHMCQKKCFEFCGTCSVLVDKKLKCGVTDEVLSVEEKALCGKICKNKKGHTCHKKFNEFCGSCEVVVEKTLNECGHTVKVACGTKNILCYELCSKTCERGHPCQKKCFELCDSCHVVVDKKLDDCGHTVQVSCSENNICCYKQCNKTCKEGHQCHKKCFEFCGKCQFLVDKTLNECGHTVKVACSETNIQCKKPCIKTCQNGHQCHQMCFESCNPCEVLVDKKLNKCGHTVKSPCCRSENNTLCYQKCEKIMCCSHQCPKKCGEICIEICKEPCLKKCEKFHPCNKKCYEECGSCTFLVQKTLEQCGHTIIAPCGMSEDKIICTFRCDKILCCSHKCTNKCGEPCIKTCMELKETQSPLCMHPIKVRCYIANNSEHLLKMISKRLFKICTELCNAVLPCGHVCRGTCGRCYQGRLHVSCKEPCKRILICGHKCMSTCSMFCPPCQFPCENKCSHSKCQKKCSDPCIKCTKKCQWSCRHKRCSRSCNEMCNRKPCDQPCPKFLSCGHSCIGFCSEPCPKECRICDNGKGCILTKSSENCRYVLLEECNHVFDVKYLNRWMSITSEGTKDILMKMCPTCKTVIRKNFRYNNVVKACLVQLEKIKQIFKWNREETLELQNHLLQKSVIESFLSNFEPSKNILFLCLSGTVRNIQELITIENIILITTSFKSLEIKENVISHHKFVRTLVEYSHITSMWLADFISKYFLIISENQLIQLVYEVGRLKLINELLKYAQPQYLELYCLDFENCSRCLLNYSPFDEASKNNFMISFQVLILKLCSNTKEISKPMEFPVLKAMDLSVGHWYQCLKGHIYCITKYIGNTEKGCNKCFKSNNNEFQYDRVKYSNMPLTSRKSHRSPHIFEWTSKECRIKREQTLRESSLVSPHVYGFTSTESRKEEKLNRYHCTKMSSQDLRYSISESSQTQSYLNKSNTLSSPGPSKMPTETKEGTELKKKGKTKGPHLLKKSSLDIHSISGSKQLHACFNRSNDGLPNAKPSKMSSKSHHGVKSQEKGKANYKNRQSKSCLDLIHSNSGSTQPCESFNKSNERTFCSKLSKLPTETQNGTES